MTHTESPILNTLHFLCNSLMTQMDETKLDSIGLFTGSVLYIYEYESSTQSPFVPQTKVPTLGIYKPSCAE